MTDSQAQPRTLRVLALTPTGVFSGAERVLMNHARTGSRFGDRWTIVAPDGDTARRLEADGLPRIRIPELKLGAGPRPVAALNLAFRNLRSLAPIRRAVREADVIVANSVLCLPLLRLLRPKAPVVWLVHDVITRGDLARIARWSVPVVTRSIPVSEAAGALSMKLGIPTTVVYNGVDFRSEVHSSQPESPPIVGLNGVLTGWKGQPVLLEAMARVDPSAVVELLGGTLPKDSPYEASLRERAQRPDLVGRVRFLGHHDAPDEVMGRWTIAVSASVEPEAAPLSVLEAMNLGLPVIVTDHGGAPEVAGDAAVVVPPDDPAALAVAITELLADPERRNRLGASARARVSTEFRRDQLEPRFRSLLHELTGPTQTDAMKVLFINENIGGHATVHHHLRRCLADRPEIEATFLDVAAPGLLRRIVGASLPGLGPLDLDLQPLRAQLALSAWVRRRLPSLVAGADVVHLYTQNAGLLSVGLLRSRPCVVSLDTTNARNAYRLPYRAPTRFTPRTIPLSMLAERRVFAAAHTVIANSRWAADSLVDDYGLPPDKLVVQPFGIAAPPVREGRSASGRPQIIFVGRQFDRKGGPVLLEAWRRSVRDRADLVLVTRDHVDSEPGVTVVDDLRQGDDRLWQLLADASIFAFPSTIDQAPNAVLEAMAAGRAVIAVPTAGITEMVIDGVTGRHVAPDDVEALAGALTELVDDRDRRDRMGRAGRERFEAVYDAHRTTDALIDIFHRALGEPTGPRR